MCDDCNHSQAKLNINPNYLEKFSCAQKDAEAIWSTILYFVCVYLIFVGVFLLVDIVIRHRQLNIGLFAFALFWASFLTVLDTRKIRCYWVDYQNNIIADMGGVQEIISFREINVVEDVDRERSFELVRSFKVLRVLGTHKTRDNKPVKVFASSRSHFVLIKTKTIPNYIISPADPKRFVEFMMRRLSEK